MDKAILKKFAIESRQDLMAKIKNKINTYYIDEEFSKEQKGDLYILSNEKHSLNLTNDEYKKRELLIKRIKELSLEQVIEEAAYTWFNRIIAIRYMEINDMLPLTRDNQSLGIRVLSSKDNTPDPEILKFTNLMNPELDIEFKKEKYAELKDDNEKFKYILLLVCQKLGRVIPQVFDGITDYIDILIPDNLLNDTGFITKIINEVPEENYNQVEIIGWLYQYYNQIEKDRVISSKKAYKKNEVPYATQLFTPDWVVKYMVDNSLGKYFKENAIELDNLEFYLDSGKSNNKNKDFNIKDFKFVDPCCGSGHILVYALEILYKVYEKLGYSKKDIISNILKYNLYGIDVDDRAEQLSILSVILKAREYDNNVFNKIDFKDLNIISIKETNNIEDFYIDYLPEKEKEIAEYLKFKYLNAKEFGSLLVTDKIECKELLNYLQKEITIHTTILNNMIRPIIKQNEILSNKYNVVVTNPPYMGIRMMNQKLLDYLEKNYSFAKYDMFSAMLACWSNEKKCINYSAMITPMAWAFLDSYSDLRKNVIENNNIDSFLHLGVGTFGNDLGMISFVLNKKQNEEKSLFIDLTEYRDGEEKKNNIFNKKLYTYKSSKDFNKFPGYQFGYWIPDKIVDSFENGNLLEKYAEPRQGLATGNNDLFLRKWYEVNFNKIGLGVGSIEEAKVCTYKWFPFNKGGNFRKWYGNNEYVINWENDGYELKKFATEKYKSFSRTIKNINYYFKKGITWSTISSKAPSFRAFNKGFIISNSGQGIYLNDDKYYLYLLGLLNTNYSSFILNFLSPTMGFESGYIRKIPIIINDNYLDKINLLVKENIELEKQDWDSYEISWEFKKIPYIKNDSLISTTLKQYKELLERRKQKIRENEILLNKYFNEILEIDNVMSSNVDADIITVDVIDNKTAIKNLISYAVGCMFGRYSFDEEGLAYAGNEFDINKYKTYKADIDNIIPITDETYFGDDIVERFKKFVSTAYGKETLNENINYIAEILGKKGTETSEDTIRRYFINDFYNDHVKMYQKCPIYWLFDSGKKNGFKALVYMHRYNENLIPKVRLDYLHRIQTTYEKLLSDVNYKLTTELSMSDKKFLQNKQVDLNAKLQEIKEYDEKIAHIANQRISIDLDDGVKENYDKFKDILAKIK